MSEANKSILIRANEAIKNGDYEGFLSFCSEDVQWTFVGEQTLKGKEAVRQYMKKVYVAPPRFVVDRMIAEDDSVVALGQITHTDVSGNDVHSTYCDVWRVRGGKLAELMAFVVEIQE